MRQMLAGASIVIEPLTPTHAAALYQALGRPEEAGLWTYMFDGPFETCENFTAAIAAKAASQDPLFYCLVDPVTRIARGYAALMRMDCSHGTIEIGNIMLSPSLQRTRAATEAMYLLARYVFEELHFRRYEWKCNDLNTPSKRAALRLGFAWEGLFRQHMIVKGRNRDTAWFAMLDKDWPATKAAMEKWLAPDNFDAAGRQIAPLAGMRFSA